MKNPLPTYAVFDDLHGQTDGAVKRELVPADELCGEFGPAIHYQCQFLGNRLLQVTFAVHRENRRQRYLDRAGCRDPYYTEVADVWQPHLLMASSQSPNVTPVSLVWKDEKKQIPFR